MKNRSTILALLLAMSGCTTRNDEHVKTCAMLYERASTRADSFAVDRFRPGGEWDGDSCVLLRQP